MLHQHLSGRESQGAVSLHTSVTECYLTSHDEAALCQHDLLLCEFAQRPNGGVMFTAVLWSLCKKKGLLSPTC